MCGCSRDRGEALMSRDLISIPPLRKGILLGYDYTICPKSIHDS